MRVLTEQHLKAARAMPRKAPMLYIGEKAEKQYLRRVKRERKLIARFYRVLRTIPQEGNAGLCHRHQVVITASEARLRLEHLEPTPNKQKAPAWA